MLEVDPINWDGDHLSTQPRNLESFVLFALRDHIRPIPNCIKFGMSSKFSFVLIPLENQVTNDKIPQP